MSSKKSSQPVQAPQGNSDELHQALVRLDQALERKKQQSKIKPTAMPWPEFNQKLKELKEQGRQARLRSLRQRENEEALKLLQRLEEKAANSQLEPLPDSAGSNPDPIQSTSADREAQGSLGKLLVSSGVAAMMSLFSALRLRIVAPYLKRTLIWAAVIGGLSVFGLLVWPTAYRYDHMNLPGGQSYPVRINRLTSSTAVLYPDGWKSTSVQDLSAEEIKKLDGRAELSYGSNILLINLYNGSDLSVKEITVEIVVRNQYGAETLRRPYRIMNHKGPSPQHAGDFSADLGFQIGSSQSWDWKIVAAKGTKD
jgi:hypothetical protein